MKTSMPVLTVACAIGMLGLMALLPSACDDAADEGTTGKRISLGVRVVGSAEANAPFTNAQGWNVTLSKALVATGALYYYDGATIFSERAPMRRSPAERLWETLVERSAFAHPGHYVPGNARGEYLVPSSADLRAATTLGEGTGVSGLVRSATFAFQTPAAGPFAAELGSHVAVLEGTASKGVETRIFRAEIDPADVTNTKNATAVEGCPFAEADMEGDGVVTVTIKVGQWFDQVEFDGVPASTDGKAVVIPATVIGRNELVRGMKEGLGYAFSYAPR